MADYKPTTEQLKQLLKLYNSLYSGASITPVQYSSPTGTPFGASGASFGIYMDQYRNSQLALQSQIQQGAWMEQARQNLSPNHPSFDCPCSTCTWWRNNSQQLAPTTQSGVLRNSGRSETLKPNKKIKNMYKDPAYFDKRYFCLAHDAYHCDDCQEESETVPTITTVAVRRDNSYRADGIKENFLKQAEFIQAGLDMSEDDLNKTKVIDMPKLADKASKEITVGRMKTYLKLDKKVQRGIIESVFRWLGWQFSKKK